MCFLAALLVTFIWQEPVESKKTPSIRDQLPPALLKEIRALEEDYGIAIELVQSPFMKKIKGDWVIKGQPLTVAAIVADMPAFIAEWRLYPPKFVKKLRVDRLYFCSDFESIDLKAQIGGTVDSPTNSIYYNFANDRKAFEPEWLRTTLIQTIHHELFHFIDHRLRADIQVDPDWERLNPTSFTYFHLSKWDSEALYVTSLFPGFITRYAENSVEEDKAETFGFMMLNLHEMECRAKDDALLGKKQDHLKRELNKYCSDVDGTFWTKVRYLSRPRLVGYGDPWAKAYPTLPELPKVELAPKVVEPVVVLENEKKWMSTDQPSVIIRRRCRCCR